MKRFTKGENKMGYIISTLVIVLAITDCQPTWVTMASYP